MATCFAPAGRAPVEVLRRQAGTLGSIEFLKAVLDASPCVTLVLNRQRQIVFGNRASLAMVGAAELRQVMGRRVGEVIGCIHAAAGPDGCGTSEACRVCGAVACAMDALAGRAGSQDCRITRHIAGRTESLDVSVSCTPMRAEGEPFVIVSLTDISDQKRRRALERIFFHDVLNTAGSIQGLAEVVGRRASSDDVRKYAGTLQGATRQLIDEIAHQRTLAAAETGELEVDPEAFASTDLLREEVERLRSCPAFSERNLEIDPESAVEEMTTDRVLLGRVIANLLRNAIEATAPGATVRAGCRRAGSAMEFWVWNPGAMPRDAQLQVFQRSFSTKGSGRGLGTYSVKLLTERYLGGSVSFVSTEEGGTEFRTLCPRAIPQPARS